MVAKPKLGAGQQARNRLTALCCALAMVAGSDGCVGGEVNEQECAESCQAGELCGPDNRCHRLCNTHNDCRDDQWCDEGLCNARLCEDAYECDDLELCNGTEQCVVLGCIAGDAPAPGTVCEIDGDSATAEICIDLVCTVSRCGDRIADPRSDELCDDGNTISGDGCEPGCRSVCGSADHCDDDDPCTEDSCDGTLCHHAPVFGVTTCDYVAVGDGICRNGGCVAADCSTAEQCNDGNDCTLDRCDADRTCAFEDLPSTPWWVDCDGDGYAATAAEVQSSCTNDAPAQPPQACSTGSWTALDPADAATTDCADGDENIHPVAPERCDNNVDNDCDGFADDSDNDTVEVPKWYVDCDGDGLAAGTEGVQHSCADQGPSEQPAEELCEPGTVRAWTRQEPADEASTDCDDADALRTRPIWYPDCDNDGYASPSAAPQQFGCVLPTQGPAGCPSGGWTAALDPDCDDANPTLNPGTHWYPDCDGDGYLAQDVAPVSGCERPAATAGCLGGYVQASAPGDDCNDHGPQINPDATEVCDENNVDENCDGLADDEDPAADGKVSWYPDCDGDTYASNHGNVLRCEAPAPTAQCSGGYLQSATAGTDCADDDEAIHPAASEICDAGQTDENCNGLSDDADPTTTDGSFWYLDCDGDGYMPPAGSPPGIAPQRSCVSPSLPAGCNSGVWSGSANVGDCDDLEASVHPGAAEVCDAHNVDEDCNGVADDQDGSATGKLSWYPDCDNDGYLAPSGRLRRCDRPAAPAGCPGGYEQSYSAGNDCDENNNAIHPGATEICDDHDVDEDCDGVADDAELDDIPGGNTAWYVDCDGDGWAASSHGSMWSCEISGPAAVPSSVLCPGAAAPGWTTVAPSDTPYTDCDDRNADLSPTTTWALDCDGDGYLPLPGGPPDLPPRMSCGAPDLPASCPTGNWQRNVVGGDCDDLDGAINPAASEVCDSGGVDENCNGVADDDDPSTVSAPLWYRDCDGDTYAASTDQASWSCRADGPTQPPTATQCPSATAPKWTSIRPSNAADTDCADDEGDVFPGQNSYFEQGFGPDETQFDYNCADGEERRWEVMGLEGYSCMQIGSNCLPIASQCPPSGCANAPRTGWEIYIPNCGDFAVAHICGVYDGACMPLRRVRFQKCR